MADTFATVIQGFDEQLRDIFTQRNTFYNRLVREGYHIDDFVEHASEDQILYYINLSFFRFVT